METLMIVLWALALIFGILAFVKAIADHESVLPLYFCIISLVFAIISVICKKTYTKPTPHADHISLNAEDQTLTLRLGHLEGSDIDSAVFYIDSVAVFKKK